MKAIWFLVLLNKDADRTLLTSPLEIQLLLENANEIFTS